MVIKNVNLETVCGITSTLPENQHPEVAFSGKSNVGKSSLINGLMNRKAYARVSQQPGKTQTINYYNVNDEIYIVDLPGYGFANVSQAVKAKWGKMIENYLRKSRQLRMVFLLVDIRHEPSANDKHMYSWIIENGFYPAIIATKLDKIKRTFVPILAAGNLVILTFHRELLHSPLKMINRNELLSDYNDILTFLLSVAVMIVFIPICQLVIRYIPVVIGNRKP